MVAKGAKKPQAKNVRASGSKAKKAPAVKETEESYTPTPDMIGRVMATGREMQDWDPERIMEIIEKHPILSKNMDYFKSLSQEELKAIIGDATNLVIQKMGEMR